MGSPQPHSSNEPVDERVCTSRPPSCGVGAGLVVSPNAVRLIRRLGVIDVPQRDAVPLEAGWEFRRWSAPEPVFARLCAYRCLVPADAAPDFARRPVQILWVGPGRHVVHYPISGGTLINVVAYVPETDWTVESWSAQGRVEDVAAEFATWDRRLGSLIEASPSAGRWAVFQRDPLPRWVEGSVALLGDAAHPMVPFLGQGAAQAIEDAAVLARCLVDGGTEVPKALRVYQDMRIERATAVQLGSRDRAEINHLPDGPAQRARDAQFAGQDPLRHNEWLYGHDAEEA